MNLHPAAPGAVRPPAGAEDHQDGGCAGADEGVIKTTLNEVISDQLKKARTVYNQHGRETMQVVADSPDVLLPMTTISAMENGKSLTPQNLKRLRDHYGVSMDYLFGDEGAAPARKVKIKLKKKQSEGT